MDCFHSPGRRLSSLALAQQRLRITGFQSPADDHAIFPPSLDAALGWGAPNIWLWIVDTDDLNGLAIRKSDVLVVDRALEPAAGNVVIVVADHEHHLALVEKVASRRLHLVRVGADGQPQAVLEDQDQVELWGVVSMLLRSMV